jgi:hypothetical protein
MLGIIAEQVTASKDTLIDHQLLRRMADAQVRTRTITSLRRIHFHHQMLSVRLVVDRVPTLWLMRIVYRVYLASGELCRSLQWSCWLPRLEEG